MKLRKLMTVAIAAMSVSAWADNHWVLSTENTSIGLAVNEGSRSYMQYYGAKISESDLHALYRLKGNYTFNTVPTLGLNNEGTRMSYNAENVLSIQQADGNLSTDIYVEKAEKTCCKDGQMIVVYLKDKVYPVKVKQCFKAYNGTDIISTWIEITNTGKKPVKMHRYASTLIPLQRGDNYLVHAHGKWASEKAVEVTKIPNGRIVFDENEGMRTAWFNNPELMITLDGEPREEMGEVFGATLLWGGNYKIAVCAQNSSLSVLAGINEDNAMYTLDGGETFVTPEFAMTYSYEGKGGVSRAFHRWARKYALQHGDKERDILLNSWEGVYFNVNEPVMDEMMKDIASLGGELFVMDDGWFGEKYPRNGNSDGLGDWMVNKAKLPNGVGGLVKMAKKNGVKFGIWIEPEMANTKSELYEKHPDWILRYKNRPLTVGRGQTQVLLDLCNPKVQDYVFGITDNLLSENPQIAYIKWDCNAHMQDYGSTYLPADRQTEINVRYHMGLRSVLQRIRDKYPDVVIQCCASGGGRISYGFLPWFDEFWCSDNTDAYQRLFIQYGASHFYPAIAMASHVSASPNHQTKREVPLKFRFDVAMTGRLGMEMQPSKMTKDEFDFAKRSVAAYKQIRPIVQFGDLYRIVSPYEHKNILSTLMYASEDKSRCAFFAYSLGFMENMEVPYLRLSGVDENRNYRIKDLTPWEADKPMWLDGKVVSGKVLKYSGIQLSNYLKKTQYGSIALELVAE